jgi:hypothetical protein
MNIKKPAFYEEFETAKNFTKSSSEKARDSGKIK